jgi:methionine-rich copper-binding protein CopC
MSGAVELLTDDPYPKSHKRPISPLKPMKISHLLSITVLALALSCLLPHQALAHAFPDHSEPRVGDTVNHCPDWVKIWFDGELEAAFSTIEVHDASGTRRDLGNGTVSPSDPTLLEVKLPKLPAGVYHVLWAVLARDGHRTKGDYTFAIK